MNTNNYNETLFEHGTVATFSKGHKEKLSFSNVSIVVEFSNDTEVKCVYDHSSHGLDPWEYLHVPEHRGPYLSMVSLEQIHLPKGSFGPMEPMFKLISLEGSKIICYYQGTASASMAERQEPVERAAGRPVYVEQMNDTGSDIDVNYQLFIQEYGLDTKSAGDIFKDAVSKSVKKPAVKTNWGIESFS